MSPSDDSEEDAHARSGVSLERNESLDTIRSDWERLQLQTYNPFFLSWNWIGTWLNLADAEVISARVFSQNVLLAMGLFCVREERRHGILRSRVAYLHQSGSQAEDQIWIEYNGLLGRDCDHTLLVEVATTLLEQNVCDEVHLSMLPIAGLVEGDELSTRLKNGRPVLKVTGRYRDLRSLRCQSKSSIDGLSANTRSQLRRARRRMESLHGPVRLETPKSAGEALAFLHEAGELHRRRWPDSGFLNPIFVDFHEHLIKRAFDHGFVSLFRVCFGEHTAGVFYFLLDSNRAYFYLQGIRPEADGRLKPGLVCHLVLMEHFLEQGLDSYDFMGGDTQYKRQLADGEMLFHSFRSHSGHWVLRLEDTFRTLKGRLSAS